jgi:hypothetical protein
MEAFGMLRNSIMMFFLMAVCTSGFIMADAQDSGNSLPLFPKADDKTDGPMGMRDMLKKLEIDKEKKDFDEMQARGKQALEISNDLEKSFGATDQLSDKDRGKLETLEKLVKKIRGELGGSEDIEPDKGDPDFIKKPLTVADGFKILRSSTIKLADELKKTSRFTISLAAIQSSNAVLRMTRFLRFSK